MFIYLCSIHFVSITHISPPSLLPSVGRAPRRLVLVAIPPVADTVCDSPFADRQADSGDSGQDAELFGDSQSVLLMANQHYRKAREVTRPVASGARANSVSARRPLVNGSGARDNVCGPCV